MTTATATQTTHYPRATGFYKPDPHPYQMALDKLGVKVQDAAFVAGRYPI